MGRPLLQGKETWIRPKKYAWTQNTSSNEETRPWASLMILFRLVTRSNLAAHAVLEFPLCFLRMFQYASAGKHHTSVILKRHIRLRCPASLLLRPFSAFSTANYGIRLLPVSPYSSMGVKHLASLFAVAFSLVSAETPQGFIPKVDTSLGIQYNGNAVSQAGLLLPKSGTS